MKVPLARIGESTEPTFQDRQVEFGKTYVYSVRSLVQYSDVAVESADSNLVLATPRDDLSARGSAKPDRGTRACARRKFRVPRPLLGYQR